MHKLLWDTEIKAEHVILSRPPDLKLPTPDKKKKKKKRKKRTSRIMDIAVSADHRVKLNKREKEDLYFDLARELKKKCGTLKWRLYQFYLLFWFSP